ARLNVAARKGRHFLRGPRRPAAPPAGRRRAGWPGSNCRFKFQKSDHDLPDMRLLLLFLGLLAVRAWAADSGDDSPFLPQNAPAASARAADGSSFELRGIMSTAGGTRYCIYDPVK